MKEKLSYQPELKIQVRIPDEDWVETRKNENSGVDKKIKHLGAMSIVEEVSAKLPPGVILENGQDREMEYFILKFPDGRTKYTLKRYVTNERVDCEEAHNGKGTALIPIEDALEAMALMPDEPIAKALIKMGREIKKVVPDKEEAEKEDEDTNGPREHFRFENHFPDWGKRKK